MDAIGASRARTSDLTDWRRAWQALINSSVT
jgi:hypothetical protein